MAEFGGKKGGGKKDGGKKGRWITTKKKHRRVFIPEGKDASEVLKETFAKYNDDDYDYYEDSDEEEYKDFDGSYKDLFYEEQSDGSITESWSDAKYQDKKDLEDKAGPGALNYVRKNEEQENELKKEPDLKDYETEKDYMNAWKDWNNSRTISVYNKKGDKASFWINDDGTISNGVLNFKSKKELMDYVSKYGWSEK